jgi:hypothetical protein
MSTLMQDRRSEEEARRVIEAYFPLFNSGDPARLVAVINFPHIRVASGTTKIIASAAEWTGDPTPLDPAERWHHSALEGLEFVQSSADKVHARVLFGRYRADGTRYVTYEALWVVTKQNGKWGIQVRSSFAP